MIRIENLVHAYPLPGEAPVAVLSLPELHLERGELAALAGPSGCGKSTLLHLIGGLMRPTKGEIWLNDVAVHRLSGRELDRFRAANVGYVFQNFNLLQSLTVEENLLLPSVFGARRPRRAVRTWIDELLWRVGMAEHRGRFPRQLSIGQQQRVAVARALVNRPAVILADEPTANLDAPTAQSVIRLLLETARASGATLLCASHDPAVLSQFAPERVVALGPSLGSQGPSPRAALRSVSEKEGIS